ncbi:GNAT family N-acetyltransferase [Planctomicrobium sp. SH664]|uniref:GNAT family N-acetyltransferase n=1 Tax=Planctomicrobium sp. SH664 TaxID=3448125 RepID=UPI003F5B581C
MQFELLVSNEQRVLPGVTGLVTEALRQLPLDSALSAQLQQLILDTIRNAIDHAYPPGESGKIRLIIQESGGKLEIRIRDFGIPVDVALLERQLHDGQGATGTLALPYPGLLSAVDEMHWLSFGREGKALQIIKWMSDEHIAGTHPDLPAFDENAPLAPPQDYDIRRMRPEEAVQVSQLMYRAYGNTYFNEDVYYPERIAALNAQETNLSFVAVGRVDGKVAGHYAVERNQPGPVAEGGQAVVDPAHRGRGLLEKMKQAALAAIEELHLSGWYADAVSVHTVTQKSDVAHGAHVMAADLAIAPRTESFRNISTEQPQRVTCLLYFHWLTAPLPRRISVPDRHQQIVRELYTTGGCAVEFLEPQTPTGAGTLTIQMDVGGGKAFVRADQPGTETARMIAHSLRQLVEHSHMEAVYAELPLNDPATAVVAEQLEQYGFGFIGVAPHFSDSGDVLRLAYLIEPLERAPIKTYEPLAGKLVDYALAEQRRVREGL